MWSREVGRANRGVAILMLCYFSCKSDIELCIVWYCFTFLFNDGYCSILEATLVWVWFSSCLSLDAHV